MSQAITSHDSLSKNFEIWYDGVQQLHQSNSQLPKNSLSGQGQFGPNLGENYAALCLMIHSLRIFLKFCGMMRNNIDRQKQPFKAQKHSIMTQCDSQTLVILANFPKKISFCTRDNFGKNYGNLILVICSVAIFLKLHDTMVYKAVLVNFHKKFFFREVTHIQFGPKLCNLLSDDLLFEDFLKCCNMKEYSQQTFSCFGEIGQFRSNLSQN